MRVRLDRVNLILQFFQADAFVDPLAISQKLKVRI